MDLLPLIPPALYLDPGAGSMLLQAIAAGIAGLVVFVKFQGHRLRQFFGGRSDDAPTADSAKDTEPTPPSEP